ncbi:uncharacterized protein N7473_005572 [Penicillium subrubescens]|uniref:Peptidase C1A papain C-terminal domain-containing protein n=1 Tax=Penicillium subrubescens TaxID=1316194 RepID=A0A1Q5T5Y5_9EURO|nr:uncharacterized protein N7473_005572 [Penicillium subrubescens]KAJ5896173.1 hypothetical protein N7473_005572 [Penicillium subrubescens]OKO95631.1 hypothetical protein PENSUB_11143 [Penicillium subrubescens]
MPERLTKEEAKKTYVLNWRPSPPSARLGAPKFTFKPEFDSTALPSAKDLSQYDSPVKDQGDIGSCTAFAAVAIVEHIAKRNDKIPDWSELYLYYNTRVKVLGWPASDDTGAYVHSAIQALYTYGDAGETDWPYDTSKFAVEPPLASYSRGSTNQVVKAAYVDTSVDAFRAAIAAGYPVDIGFWCYSNLYDHMDSGLVDMPKQGGYIIGGHSVMLVGYDDYTRRFKFKNSWSTRFGQAGYGFLPYEYVSGYTLDEPKQRLVSDCWTIASIEFDSDFVILYNNPPENVPAPFALTAVAA